MIRHPVMIGALVCLLLGAGASALAGSFAPNLPPPPVVTVPIGHYGDRVTYANWDRWDDSCRGMDGTPAFTDFFDEGRAERLSGAESFVVDAAHAILDAGGAAHDGLVVRARGSAEQNYGEPSVLPDRVTFFSEADEVPYPAPAPSEASAVSCPPRSTPAGGLPEPVSSLDAEASTNEPRTFAHYWGAFEDRVALTQYVDLGTRAAFRTETGSPDANARGVAFDAGTAELRGLDLQGRTLTVGEDLEPVADLDAYRGWSKGLGGIEEHWGWTDHARTTVVWREGQATVVTSDPGEPGRLVPGHRAWAPEVRSIRSHTWVAGAGHVNGHDAVAVDREVVVTYRPPGHADGPWLTWRTLIVEWMTSDSPYAILVQTDRFDQTLSSFEPGETPIPWTPGAPWHASPRNPGTFTIGLPPSDGTDSPVPYPLAAAQAAASDVGGLASWRTDHADAVLAAARFDAQGATWRLLYATPAGDGYEVQATMGPGGPQTRDVGPGRTPAFTFAPTPTGAFAGAIQAWRAQTGSSGAPGVLEWGLPAWGATDARPPTTPDACPTRPSDRASWAGSDWIRNRDFLREVVVGTRVAPCARITYDTSSGTVVEMATEHATPAAPAHAGSAPVPPRIESLSAAGLQAPIVVRLPDPQQAALASGALFVVFLAAYLAPVLKFAGTKMLLAAGYSKLARSDLLDHRVRDALLTNIGLDPGVSTSDLGRRVGVAWGTLVYHLAVLERNKLVSSLVDGRHRRFFPVGTVDWSRRGQIAVLQNERTKSLYEAIASDPGAIQERLAAAAGLSRPGAIWHLHRLEEAGLVGRVKEGRKVHYFPNAEPPGPEPPGPREGVEIA